MSKSVILARMEMMFSRLCYLLRVRPTRVQTHGGSGRIVTDARELAANFTVK
jgi:hypothetical protein